MVHSNFSALTKRGYSLSTAQKNLQKFMSPREQQKKTEANVVKTANLLDDFDALRVTPVPPPAPAVESSTSVMHVEKEVVKAKRPSGGAIPMLQPPSSDTVRRTSKTAIDDPFNLNGSYSSSSIVASSNPSKATLLDDLFGNSSSTSATTTTTYATTNNNALDPFADPFANTSSAIDSLMSAQQTKITNKVDPLSLYPNQRQQFQPAVYGNPNMATAMPMSMPMQMPVSMQMSMQMPIQQSAMPMQQSAMSMQQSAMPMHAPTVYTSNIIPSQIPQATNIIPPAGHVSNLIQKFDPNSPTKRPSQTETQTNVNIEQKDSANPFDLF